TKPPQHDGPEEQLNPTARAPVLAAHQQVSPTASACFNKSSSASNLLQHAKPVDSKSMNSASSQPYRSGTMSQPHSSMQSQSQTSSQTSIQAQQQLSRVGPAHRKALEAM
ncbi:unnamed protein product, partial [Amoebophrya sp. A25]